MNDTFIITINKLPYDVKLKHSYWTDYNGPVKQMPDIIEAATPAAHTVNVTCFTFLCEYSCHFMAVFSNNWNLTGSEDKPESFDRGFQRLCRRLNWKSKDINLNPAQSVIIVRCDTFHIFMNTIKHEIAEMATVSDCSICLITTLESRLGV